MKVILIQPPIRDFYDTDIRLQPLGLCMLKAAMKKFLPDVEVIVKDYHQRLGRRTIAYPKEFSYLKEYYQCHDKSPFSTFHHFYHFGAGFDDIASDIAGEHPDLVGISSLFSPYFREALSCAKAVKGAVNAPIIMGGSHVSAVPFSILKDPNVDYIIRGEGERPFVEFIKAMRSGGSMKDVPNLGFKQNSDIILNPISHSYDLKELPEADFSDFPVNRYSINKKPLCFIIASRGCPHRCSFCSVHLIFGDGFRLRPIEHVISEMIKRYDDGYRIFDFEDDNLTFDRDYFKELLTRLISIFPEDDILLAAMNGISYLNLDSEILVLMKRAGFRSLNLSLVSSTAATLKRFGRPHDLKKFMGIVETASLCGFNIVAYQILGLPNETMKDMIETMVLLAGLPVLIGVSVFYLTPGSPVAEEFPEMSIEDIVRSRSTAMAMETDQFNRDDIYTLFITARVMNFIKGIIADKKEIDLVDAMEAAKVADKRSALGADILKMLFKEKILYAAEGNGMKIINRFKTNLFFKVWEKIPFIATQTGGRVNISRLLSP